MSLAENKDTLDESKLPKRMTLEGIDWDAVAENLQSKYKVKPIKSAKLIDAFKQLIRAPFEISWYQDHELSGEMHMLIASVCDVHNADSVTVSYKRTISFIGMKFDYCLEVNFLPNPNGVGIGTLKPLISVSLLGKVIVMRDLLQVASARLLMLCGGILAYVLVVGVILYTLAVWFVFERMTKEVLNDAISNPYTGLALILAFVVIAGFLGKMVSYLGKKFIKLSNKN